MSAGPSRILPFLYLGSAVDARSASKLSVLGVSRILNVSDSARFEDDPRIVLKHILVSDFGDTNLVPVFSACNEFIAAAKSEGATILVHCRHGQNRSPTVVLAYLMEREGVSLKDAYHLVSTVRPNVAVHEAYFEQLRQLEISRYGANSLSQDDVGPSV
jgi:protein-tyrosine phosphatase